MNDNKSTEERHAAGLISHERLAWFLVMGLYVTGILLTSLVVVKVLTWGLLASYGRVRMVGLLVSFAGIGFFASRVIAGRYGNRLAAHWMPRTLDNAVSARLVMQKFGLRSGKELNAFILIGHLRVYSVAVPPGEVARGFLPELLAGWSLRDVMDTEILHTEIEGTTGKFANTAHDLPCMLEPLFTHDMYLPMMRTWLVRTNRLWFDGDEMREMVQAGRERYQDLTLPHG